MTGAPPADGRTRVHREVVSFVRRSARMSSGQRRVWDTLAPQWVLDVAAGPARTSLDPTATLDLVAAFGREAPLVVEIGSGIGASLVPMAAARPDTDVLAFEVYEPAVARTVAALDRHGVHNVRLLVVDAVAGLDLLLAPASIDELWVFFPDPWPKSRHHKRRLVTPRFAELAADRLKPGALWRLATDWADYALAIREVLDACPALENLHPGGWAPRWDERPVTRFEERGREAGREILDLTYRRR